ncbi:hypothetical protein DOTSEDRAFT_44413 [Dothistroma septosporum NZE10]|uniref:Uncharacterized protein n=1 Tax=Dothistroma septosporum (strain NZE10 / CBS 128990) TaxID=675120 RepID=N1PMI6_DOTSN|nr:hypothetical protein DOTSEDRAFT_44413 [Dothistroma septosporum NZE10]
MQADVPVPGGAAPTAGLLGDIVANRYKTRGVQGAIIDGRIRDVVGCGKLCKDGEFVTFTKGVTSVGTGLQLKPWAVDIPLNIGSVIVKPGDIICADEAEQVVVIIPQDKLKEVLQILPKLKQADEAVLRDAESGVDLKSSFAAHPDHYTHFH